MVARIDTQRTIISRKARSGRCNPKKSGVQAAFSTSCKAKMASGNAAPAKPASRQTNQPETAMVRYRTVQIGANSQFGGRHRGSTSRSYQPPVGTPRREWPRGSTRPRTRAGQRGKNLDALDYHEAARSVR